MKLELEDFVERYHRHKRRGIKFYCPLDYHDTLKLYRGVSRVLPPRECAGLDNIHNLKKLCELSVFDSMVAAGEITPWSTGEEVMDALKCANCPGKRYADDLEERGLPPLWKSLRGLALPVGVVGREDGKILMVNRGMAEMIGYPMKDFEGEFAEDFYVDRKVRRRAMEILRYNSSVVAPSVELKRRCRKPCRANLVFTTTRLDDQCAVVALVLNHYVR